MPIEITSERRLNWQIDFIQQSLSDFSDFLSDTISVIVSIHHQNYTDPFRLSSFVIVRESPGRIFEGINGWIVSSGNFPYRTSLKLIFMLIT